MKRIAIAAALSTAACAVLEPPEAVGPALPHNIVAVTEDNVLVAFNAGQPQRVARVGPVRGLQAGERVLGLDYRVARGVLYALGSSGRIYTVDARSAEARAVGAPLAVALDGDEFGFDFNPAADRIRIVSDRGQNLRAHPDTGAAVDGDPARDGIQPDGPLAYAAGDANAGRTPRIVAAGYTYNARDGKITTNYAIDAAAGALVMQGSKEGATPAVSPNAGQLFTVGSLGIGRFASAGLDISDVGNSAYAAVNALAGATRFYSVDLATGKAAFIGTVAGARLRGIAIEP
ncbi:MAG TPA: DUF4394 domain-containing protein [Usitatibacter sp.]|nr:DUF4394 domain-containing protein [Usitatibacter sp.]